MLARITHGGAPLAVADFGLITACNVVCAHCSLTQAALHKPRSQSHRRILDRILCKDLDVNLNSDDPAKPAPFYQAFRRMTRKHHFPLRAPRG